MDKDIQEQIEAERAKYSEYFDKLTKAIGKYIISFEEIMLNMRICIEELFKRHGLINRSFVDVIFADMQADNMFKRFDGLIAITFPVEMNDAETTTMLKKLYCELEDVIKFRNKLAHAHWHIQHSIDSNTNEFDSRLVATGQRIKRFKGAQANFPDVDFEYVKELENKTESNHKLCSKIGEICINIRQKTPIKRKWHI